MYLFNSTQITQANNARNEYKYSTINVLVLVHPSVRTKKSMTRRISDWQRTNSNRLFLKNLSTSNKQRQKEGTALPQVNVFLGVVTLKDFIQNVYDEFGAKFEFKMHSA